MKYAIEYMSQYSLYPYYFLVSLYFAMLAFFTFAHMVRLYRVVGDTDFDENGEFAWTMTVTMVCFGLTVVSSFLLVFLESEVMWRQGLSLYMRKSGNTMQLLAYITVVISSIFSILIDSGAVTANGGNIIGCVAMAFAWTSSLSYLRGFAMFASIISTLEQILYDMRGFFLLVLVLLVGATAAFKVLLPRATAYDSFQSLVTVWNIGINGDIDLDGMEVNTTASDPSHAAFSTTVATIFALMFGFVMLMVLMNQLIALMGDSYSHVMENLMVETLKARGEVIIDVQATFGDKILHMSRHFSSSEKSLLSNIDREMKHGHEVGQTDATIMQRSLKPRWLHVLRPRSLKSFGRRTSSDWEGALKSMKRSIGACQQNIGDLSVKLDDKIENMDQKISHVLRLLLAGVNEEEMLAKEKLLRANRKLGALRSKPTPKRKLEKRTSNLSSEIGKQKLKRSATVGRILEEKESSVAEGEVGTE